MNATKPYASGSIADDGRRIFERHLPVETLRPDLHRVTARFAFAEDAEVPTVLEALRQLRLGIDPAYSTFFVGRETLLATDRPGMALWRERLFALLARNARRATKFFHLPPERVCKLGSEIEF